MEGRLHLAWVANRDTGDATNLGNAEIAVTKFCSDSKEVSRKKDKKVFRKESPHLCNKMRMDCKLTSLR